MQKSVLGKGLASLLPSAGGDTKPTEPSLSGGVTAAGPATTVPQHELANRDRHPGISLASVDDIQVNPFQPRREFEESAIEELAASIRANGIIQPLVVRKLAHGFQLIAGERRLRAAKKVGLKQIPVVIRRSTDREALELALIENIQRQDLNCIDEALAYFQLMQEFTMTQEEVAERVGKDRATVANFLRLLRLQEPIIDELRRGTLSHGHGKVLLSVEESDLRLKIFKEVLEKNLSVRQTEVRIQEAKGLAQAQDGTKSSEQSNENPGDPVRARLANLSVELSRIWSTRVEFVGTDKKGKIVLKYKNRNELERLIAVMQNESVWQNQQI